MTTSLIERCAAYVESQGLVPGSMQIRRNLDKPVITVSRQTGTRSRAICDKLVAQLNVRPVGPPWTIFDKSLLQKMLEDHHHPLRLAKFMPEDREHILQGIAGEILGLHPSLWTLFEETTETILKLAHLGHAVIVGRGAAIIAAHLPNAFHFRFVGSLERRIERVLEIAQLDPDQAVEVHQHEHHSMVSYIRSHFGHYSPAAPLSRKDAEHFVQAEDRARRRYVKSQLHRDVDDPLLYHLIINTDDLSDDAVVSTLFQLAQTTRT
jgi:cytidylate kinase